MLNNLKKIYQLDKNHAYKSLEYLPDQIRQVLHDSLAIKIPKTYSKIDRIVVNGMGGSNLGARIVQSVFSEELKKPIIITAGYEVPGFVDKNTLYILSSYSGDTEEALSVYGEVKKRGSKIIAITSRGQGQIEKLMLRDNLPGYIFNPEFNPAGPPRLGIGYAVFGLAALLARIGILNINVKELEKIINKMEIWTRELRPENPIKLNKAKQLAQKLKNKLPILVGAEFLAGNTFAMRNQFCESGKNFASWLTLPDLNHFAMEGLSNPKNNAKNLIFLFFNSSLYHPRVQKRLKLTEEVVEKNKIKNLKHTLQGVNKLEQAMELLQFGTYLTYYAGLLNNANPAPNPWVDWFKKQLG